MSGLKEAKKLIAECLKTKSTRLNLSGLEITSLNDLPELADCIHLKSLNLWGNLILVITPLEKLTQLNFLDLSFNKILDITPLEKLHQLNTLKIRFNKISDVTPLENLYQLNSLDLRSNKILDVTLLENLPQLKTLNLSSNQILNITPLENLYQLKTLNLSSNQILDITPLENSPQLTALNLSHNQISTLSRFFFEQFKSFELEKGYLLNKALNLAGNPIQSPPIEILKQGRQSVLDWFDAKKQLLKEVKIILIGDPKAGKTSLLKRLNEDKFNENEVQTDGINIESIAFGENENFTKQTSLHSLAGHFWDFGGQEIMNATHQFFLTNRSVYVLVLDARKDKNVAGQMRQWVKQIVTIGGNSPIVVVCNQIDVNTGFGFENESQLRQEFPQIKYFIKTSCKTNQNLDLLKDILEELIPKAELFHTEIDQRWIKVKDQLQEETADRHFLNESRFLEICEKHGLTDEKGQKNAIHFLNDLGLVLHFEDVNLSEYFVLDPYWITYGVYQIVTSQFVGEQKGKVAMTELDYIINKEEDKKETYVPKNKKKIRYSNNEMRFLVDILHEFKLCFYLPHRTHFILPDLLDTQEPEAASNAIRNSEENIQFIYEYAYLPKSLMPQVMVETHHLIRERWRTGCILEHENSKALILAYENRLSITVIGEYKQKREFMSVIRHLIDKINQKLTDQPDRSIPLPDNLGFADYEELLEREKDGEKGYKIFKPKKMVFEISRLLEGMPDLSSDLGRIEGKLDEVLKNQDEMLGILKDHYQYVIQRLGNDEFESELVKSIETVDSQKAEKIVSDVMEKIENLVLDGRLDAIHSSLKNTKKSHWDMKLKLSIPFISLLGIDTGISFDVKSWAEEMYKKHELEIFKLMGYL